ncbi:hypothetical protein GCM10010358_56270 [Streptomyces minutiscleroticus]|uniref:Uncharacterized protein n=1 Tax=Streptomyces minutiscleroticus TaxID=68238 RepID=A0A918NU97_9ACTN|nr:hypothetical protein GCM10010358_56270 [Streptomyces minutiscleroticus]
MENAYGTRSTKNANGTQHGARDGGAPVRPHPRDTDGHRSPWGPAAPRRHDPRDYEVFTSVWTASLNSANVSGTATFASPLPRAETFGPRGVPGCTNICHGQVRYWPPR